MNNPFAGPSSNPGWSEPLNPFNAVVKSTSKQPATPFDVFNPAVDSQVRSKAAKQKAADETQALSERLYINEPRSASEMYGGNPHNKRGPVASIRLIGANNPLQSASGNTDIRNSSISTSLLSNTTYQKLIQKTSAIGKNEGIGNAFDHFLLEYIDVQYSEKTQIMTTFGDQEVVYYFGKNPVVVAIQGLVVDTLQNNWFVEFITLYNTFLRGTQLAKNFEMLELVLPNMSIVGSIISLGYQQSANRDMEIPFSMQFYAKEMIMLPQPGLLGIPSNQFIEAGGVFNTTTKSSAASIEANKNPSITGSFTEPDWLKHMSESSDGITASANKFFNNANSPVVSTLASLTKTISNISNNAEKLTSSFTNPLNALLSGITSISTQATGIANLITNASGKIGQLLSQPKTNLKNTLSALKKTAGTITRLPQSVSQAFQSNVHSGKINGTAAILSSGKKLPVHKAAAISSGKPYTPQISFNV